MRVSRLTISISLIIASFGLALPRVAAAETLYAPAQQFVVHGVVPERREIVLDAAGNISQIFSNSDNTVAPTVTSGSLAGPSVPLTPQFIRPVHRFDEPTGHQSYCDNDLRQQSFAGDVSRFYETKFEPVIQSDADKGWQ